MQRDCIVSLHSPQVGQVVSLASWMKMMQELKHFDDFESSLEATPQSPNPKP